jgi:hypothetical protein
MAGMRACATASLFAVVSFAFTAMFSACASAPPDATTPEGGNKPAVEGESAKKDDPSSTTPGEGQTAAGTSATTAPQAPRKDPDSVADCKQLLTEITNNPPANGVVMNNAQAADAGTSDRFTPMSEVVQSKRDAFRCCFDLWAKKNPGQKAKVTFVFELAPDGTLKSSKVDHDKSDMHVPEVESCMVDVSKSMTYPKSPSGKVTLFSYPFEFKAHR